MILIFCLIVLIVLIWALLTCKDIMVCSWCRKGKTKHEAWWTNVLIRFLLLVNFEIVLCLTIELTAYEGNLYDQLASKRERDLRWALILTSTAIVILSFLLLLALCLRGGPYVRNTYERGSLKKSFWGKRREVKRVMVMEALMES